MCEGLLTGIISTGDGCGDAKYPGIYSDVEYYYNWIQNVVGDTFQLSTTTLYEFSSSTPSSVATTDLTELYTTSTVSTCRTSTEAFQNKTEIMDSTTDKSNFTKSTIESTPNDINITMIIDTTTSHDNDRSSSVLSKPIILILVLITFVLVV